MKKYYVLLLTSCILGMHACAQAMQWHFPEPRQEPWQEVVVAVVPCVCLATFFAVKSCYDRCMQRHRRDDAELGRERTSPAQPLRQQVWRLELEDV